MHGAFKCPSLTGQPSFVTHKVRVDFHPQSFPAQIFACDLTSNDDSDTESSPQYLPRHLLVRLLDRPHKA